MTTPVLFCDEGSGDFPIQPDTTVPAVVEISNTSANAVQLALTQQGDSNNRALFNVFNDTMSGNHGFQLGVTTNGGMTAGAFIEIMSNESDPVTLGLQVENNTGLHMRPEYIVMTGADETDSLSWIVEKGVNARVHDFANGDVFTIRPDGATQITVVDEEVAPLVITNATAPAGSFITLGTTNDGGSFLAGSDDGMTVPYVFFRADANIDINPAGTTPTAAVVGFVKANRHDTTENCSDSAGDAACGNASAGSVVVDAGDTTTVISTTAVSANSQIFVLFDSSLGARLSVTCNATVALPSVTARTAGTNFTISVPAAPVTNPACYSFLVVN
jgi:hypothetical protein